MGGIFYDLVDVIPGVQHHGVMGAETDCFADAIRNIRGIINGFFSDN